VGRPTADRADRLVKARRFRRFEVGEEQRHPWLDVRVEEFCGFRRIARAEAAIDEARHDLEDGCDMILGLADIRIGGDAERFHVDAQARERLFMEKAGQIVGLVWEKFAATDADKQLLEFVGDIIRIGRCRGGRQTRYRLSDRCVRIAFEPRKGVQHLPCRRGAEERR
jgi:hypothetical protein